MSNVLELQSVSRVYAQGDLHVDVLRSLNLSLKKGTMAALVGPSGSGKTTLLQIAGLLDVPTEGTVRIDGHEVPKDSEVTRTRLRNRHIGFVYQFHHLLAEFSALENIILPQLMAGSTQHAAQKRAEELLDMVGLSVRGAHRPAELSGGEQQRVAIARALANNPALILADEPTGNLDEENAAKIVALLLSLAREHGTTALIATHNLELAARMDETWRMEAGRVVRL